MTDEQFLQRLPRRDYVGLSDLELTARREAMKYPTEFPPMFRMRPFLEEAIRRGWIRVENEYILRIDLPQQVGAD